MGIPVGQWPPGQFTRQVVRAAAALGATWDASPLEIQTGQYAHALLYISYTRGAAGGAVDLRIEVSPYSTSAEAAGAQEWFRASVYAAGAVAANSDVASAFQRDIITYGAVGATAEHVVYGPIALNRCVCRMRVACRESGAPATPGTCEIVAHLGY